jgi:ubiquinone/menaquinone biosynthesis C-methylase UbiE
LCMTEWPGYIPFLDRLVVRKIARLGITEGRALDVGCGSGLLSIELSQAVSGLHIAAVDLSEVMLELARGNAQQANAGGIEFVRADAKALPFEDCTFDIVFSQHTLHHLPDPQALLSEMERVVRVGGYVLLRDLRRPRRASTLTLYVRVLGAVYNKLGDDSAIAKSLYRASLAAALSRAEWDELAEMWGNGTSLRCQTHPS